MLVVMVSCVLCLFLVVLFFGREKGVFVMVSGEWRECAARHHTLIGLLLVLRIFSLRYKMSLGEEHVELLREVIRKHRHYQITPEIRRELDFAVEHASRGGDVSMGD